MDTERRKGDLGSRAIGYREKKENKGRGEKETWVRERLDYVSSKGAQIGSIYFQCICFFAMSYICKGIRPHLRNIFFAMYSLQYILCNHFQMKTACNSGLKRKMEREEGEWTEEEDEKREGEKKVDEGPGFEVGCIFPSPYFSHPSPSAVSLLESQVMKVLFTLSLSLSSRQWPDVCRVVA